MYARFFVVGLFYFLTRDPCRGFSSTSVDRIINGAVTDIHSVPYVLSFMQNDKYICCAVIIDRQWAVTAAHCVTQAIKSGYEITVRSGSSFLYEGGTVHRVIEIVIHENYNEHTNDYDIALLKVTSPFTYDDRTRAVDLPPDDAQEISDKRGVVCGWGYYKKTDNVIDEVLSKRLQCVQLPLMKRSECHEDYKNLYTLTPRMKCYGFQNGKRDSCKGDSGSALVNDDHILIGLTSWGNDCARKNAPGVYTDTVLLRNWIKDNMID